MVTSNKIFGMGNISQTDVACEEPPVGMLKEKKASEALKHAGDFSIYKAENGMLLVFRDGSMFKSWIVSDGKDLAEKITSVLIARKITE